MKQLRLVVGLLMLTCAFPTLMASQADAANAKKKKPPPAPPAQTYLTDRYDNNSGPGGALDHVVRLINVGQGGSPTIGPNGDVCANFYIFDNSQIMIACCTCRIPPNALATASIGRELTYNPLTSVVPAAGVITIVPMAAGPAPTECSAVAPIASSDASLLQGSSTHIEISGPATHITETSMRVATLGTDEAAFLSNACVFVLYLGSGGRGNCGCNVPGN